MKGKIKITTDFYTDERIYKIFYKTKHSQGFADEYDLRYLKIYEEDMLEFMDDIFSSWMKLDNKTEIIERRATESVKARKDEMQCKESRAYKRGYEEGYKIAMVITEQEEAEQDKDELERDSETKTYNNFPTDEALDFDVNVRERV